MRCTLSTRTASRREASRRNQEGSGLTGLIVSLALLIVPVGICAGLYWREADYVEQRLRDRETVRMVLLDQIFRAELQPVAGMLRLLADGDGLHAYLDSNRPDDRERINRRAAFVSQQHEEYDQIHFLDEHGFEIIRSDHHGVIVPANQLQDASDRPFFLEARSLPVGQIYLSGFDLNSENGRIEEPFKPVLRFSTPVVDGSGRRRGVYVINLRGEELLDHLRNAAPQQRLRLLDPQGHWIEAEDPAIEWGSVLPNREAYSLARTDPELWAQITAKKEGQVRRAGGLFTWHRVTAAEVVGGNSGVVAKDAYWIVASEISAAVWANAFSGIRHLFLVAALGLFGLSASSLWFLRARQRAVQELRRSQENLAVTVDSIGDAVIATDTDGKISRMNGVAEKLTGWTLAEARGRAIGEVFRIVNEFTRAPAVMPVDDVLATGKTHGLTAHITLIARDGSERSIADSAAPIRERNGPILGVVLVFRDVSEQRRMAEIQGQLAAIIESSADAVLSTSPSGLITSWNHAAEILFGYTLEEAVGRPVDSLVPPGRAKESELSNVGQAGDRTALFETVRMRKDGKLIHVSVAVSPINNAAGEETEFSQIIRDITARKEDEEKIRILNSALRQRAKELEGANGELEAFSYSVSHDLRAPLRHVQGFVELLKRELPAPLSANALHYMKTISTAGRTMGELIDSLLSFSRMGRREMTASTLDLGPLIQECRKTLELTTREREIRWKILPLPKVRGDAAMIRQVVANLLDNAVKYTRQRSVAEITVGCDGLEAGWLVFYVRDNGAGFEMKYVEKLFGVFQRLHRADEFEGSGIGLANVRRIILRHGGRAWAEGKVGEGAVFYFTLQPALPE